MTRVRSHSRTIRLAAIGLALTAAFSPAWAADPGEPWTHEPSHEGLPSVPDQECAVSGLVVAPWGVYVDLRGSLIIWCVSAELYETLNKARPDRWIAPDRSVQDARCRKIHLGLSSHADDQGHFWCTQSVRTPGAAPGGKRGLT